MFRLLKRHMKAGETSTGKRHLFGAVLAVLLVPSYSQAHSDWETVAVGAVVGAVLVDALYEHEQSHKRKDHHRDYSKSYPSHHSDEVRVVPVHRVHKKHKGKKYHQREHYKRKHHKGYHHDFHDHGYRHHPPKTKLYYSGHHRPYYGGHDHRHCPPKRHHRNKLRVHF